MKNVACIVLTCALVLIFSTPAFCGEKTETYLSVFTGVFQGEDTDGTVETSDTNFDVSLNNWDPGYIGGVAVGKKSWHWRVDGEYAYGTILGGDDNNTDLMLHMLSGNLYYDFLLNKKWTPYISVGIGLGQADISGDYGGDPSNFSIFQIGSGLSFDISQNLSIDVRYRFLQTSEVEFEDSGVALKFNLSVHSALMGVRFYF